MMKAGKIKVVSLVVLFMATMTSAWLYKEYQAETPYVSYDDSLKTARKLIGPKVIDVLPYKDKGSDNDRILVLHEQEWGSSLQHGKLSILEGKENYFTRTDLDIDVLPDITSFIRDGYKGAWRKEIQTWGLADINHDGIHEVFGFLADAGSGFSTYSYSLWDPVTREENGISASYQNGRSTPSTSLEIKDGPNKAAYVDWLHTSLRKAISAINDVSEKSENEVWEEDNGRGFTEGQVKTTQMKGGLDDLTKEASVACLIDEATVQWVSLFKGGVYLIDKAKGVHRLLFLPEDSYQYVKKMISGKRFLWLGFELPAKDENGTLSGPRVLAYEKTERNLIGFPVKGTDDITLIELGKFKIDGDIAEDEFTGAIACSFEVE